MRIRIMLLFLVVSGCHGPGRPPLIFEDIHPWMALPEFGQPELVEWEYSLPAAGVDEHDDGFIGLRYDLLAESVPSAGLFNPFEQGEEYGRIRLIQPHELTPIYFLRIPGTILRDKGVIGVSVIAYSSTGGRSTKTVFGVSRKGVIKYDPAGPPFEEQVKQLIEHE